MESNKKPIHAKPSLFAFYLEVIKEIGLKYGYNIVPHGSFNRDLDLIAIPWEEVLGDKEKMVDEICTIIGGHVLDYSKHFATGGKRYSLKPHGRIVYVININRVIEMRCEGFLYNIKEYSDPQYYIDLSIMPNTNI